MVITGFAFGYIMIHAGIWRYYHSERKSGRIISIGIIVAAVLIIAGTFVTDYIIEKNSQQNIISRYSGEECKPLVLSGGDTDGKVNIIKCNDTILQVDEDTYEKAVSGSTEAGGRQD